MSEPKFCPNCGAPLPEGPRGRQPFFSPDDPSSRPPPPGTGDRWKGDGGWDCSCDACKWSGDILPDDEAEA